MTGSMVDYHDGAKTCEAYVSGAVAGERRPAVLIAHQWAGQSEHERETADRLAALGYVGIAIDVYGKGRRGLAEGDEAMAVNAALMNPWVGDRKALGQRLMAAVDFAKGQDAVDPGRIAIIGYCFGGLCALDVARTGTEHVKGAVSIHGLFAPPAIGPQVDIATAVLILHGWDDPMAPSADVIGIARELTEAKADWQLHSYGHALHAFTAKGANMPERGIQYNASADRRSWAAAVAFLAEVLA